MELFLWDNKMTVKEVIEYIISKSKDDESLLTDTKRFWAYLSDLAPEHRKELKVIKRSLDSEFLTLCFKDKEDIKRRVFKMKFRLEEQGVGENWIDFIIESFFTPLGWKPPQDEEETSQIQNQQTQNQQIQKQQIQKQQTQKQQTQKQQTQKQQTQKHQTQKQQTQKQQTQKQQTQKQQTQNQQTQKQQAQKQQIQNQQTQKQQTQKQQNGGTRWYIAILIFVGIFILAIIFSNSNKNDIKEQVTYSAIETANVGDYIKFGSYPQTSRGQEQPIEWQVLSKENNKILVISRYGLNSKRFDGSSNVWGNSEIRQWLNGDFYNNAFSDSEKKYINSSYLSDVGTSDNVFLLSIEEVEKYFANYDSRKCKATDYAVKNGAASRNGCSWWWLRSSYPSSGNFVYYVSYGGDVSCFTVNYAYVVARPALWINLNVEQENLDLKSDSLSEVSKSYNNQSKKQNSVNSNPFTNTNVGDYIKFGSYPQTSSGQEQPIEWQVLAKENNKMLVITRYGLEAKRFDNSSNKWKNSEIRQWLNGDFYNKAFSEDDKKYIKFSNLSDVGTSDNVFLLSREEAKKYFANNDLRMCKATDYAVKNGAWVDSDNACCWWLRSPDPDFSNGVFRVRRAGDFSCYDVVSHADTLVRSALWINLNVEQENLDLKSDSLSEVSKSYNNQSKKQNSVNSNPFTNTNVGDYIKFGSYPQTSSGQKQSIEWQVLSKANNKILVISRYGLDAKRFDSSSNVWSNSEIRKWLNGDFYNQAFTDQEKKSINLSNLSDVGTSDNVFLLSKEEAEKYFSNKDERRCRATEYAVKNGADVYNDNGYSSWWLRSPMYNFVYNVSYGGGIDYSYVCDSNGVVRLALWINL